MILGPRIAARRKALGISQAELGRRAGVPQTTMNGLEKGNHRSSPHLVRIAHQLHTTPAYLTGETDDPDAESAQGDFLDAESRELVDLFAALGPGERRALLQVARSMAGEGKPARLHSPKRSYRAPE